MSVVMVDPYPRQMPRHVVQMSDSAMTFFDIGAIIQKYQRDKRQFNQKFEQESENDRKQHQRQFDNRIIDRCQPFLDLAEPCRNCRPMRFHFIFPLLSTKFKSNRSKLFHRYYRINSRMICATSCN